MMNDALVTVLKEYGLNQKEAMIYLVVLELGKAPASTIARQIGLKRVTAYAIIQEMIRKGVLTELDKKGVKSFSVIDPQQLHAQREVRCKTFQSALPEFAALADVRGNKPRIQYFEGYNGVLSIYDDMLTSEVDICAFMGIDEIDGKLKKQLLETHVKRRIQLGINARVILPNTDLNKEYQSWNEEQLRETCLVSDPLFNLANEIDIYGPNKISLIMYTAEEMSGVVIYSEKLYESLIGIFTYVRKNEKSR